MLTVDFSKLELKPGFKVLDAGCGGGRHLSEAYRARGVSVVGIDLNRDDALKAHNTTKIMRHEGEHGGGASLVMVSDVTRLPFKDASFDLVICSEVLEHIPDHRQAIAEVIRVLKPGRSLVVSVPRYLPERICWALSEDYHNEEGGHIRIYRTGDLINLLERAGTTCVDKGWAHALHSPYWWIKCMVGHKNDSSLPVRLYHRFLVWDIVKKPLLTRTLDKLLNPLIAKSVVLYCRKGASYGT
ncbi:MAG TPA: class I SAM-dependent methyltransferase [Deltaproteobacteria bacterium]|jgi:SAM-dependent methyltransferase|nr:class I SAM-dependent methyltransferase [Deltaproteobacteria bacterium]HRW81797.1 class I SAM-dependent methyltransferase [Desulfomonilia bacterium]NMD41188.1 class I SAM-dependent methyltransferase [Deltaproteobacteria bacterium]HNQ86180.1 class I SAM-dependent methyltransferase [Deltaproteobacteria bacterium]HNS89015.1 class I SAM-dependent methyltransferase [Deltaproteobacteria bacterium]